jgi:hypothetical protein
MQAKITGAKLRIEKQILSKKLESKISFSIFVTSKLKKQFNRHEIIQYYLVVACTS